MTVPSDDAVARRLLSDYLSLVMLVGTWRMSDGDDFAALWSVSRAVAESTEKEKVT